MKNRWKKILIPLIFLVVCAGITVIIMLLWNALIPQIIGWSTINYWQALGLLVLCRLLLGGFGGTNKWQHWHAHKHFHKIHQEMCNMTKDERREFIRRRIYNDNEPIENNNAD